MDKHQQKEKILIAMSGGVDSSVAGLILKNEGYQVQGAILRIRDDEMTPEDITNGKLPQSIWYSRETARRLRIGFSIIDARKDYQEKVLEPLLAGFASGIQKDPWILCNQQVKRPLLLQLADQLDCTHVATGHYAIVRYDPVSERYLLRKGRDAGLDQSFMLYYLSQKELARLMTPLGDYTKEEIRQIARDAKLKNAAAPDSIALDSLPEGDHITRVENLLKNIYGETAVQAYREKTADRQRSDILSVGDVNFVSLSGLSGKRIPVSVKVRYLSAEQKGTATITEDGILQVQLEKPIDMIPGQSIVLYQEDLVVAGGVLLGPDRIKV
mgnify:CR=1 FL=1